MRFQEPAMVGQKQPQSHMKCEDQGSPQTRGKQRCCQKPPELIVLSTPRREKIKGALEAVQSTGASGWGLGTTHLTDT